MKILYFLFIYIKLYLNMYIVYKSGISKVVDIDWALLWARGSIGGRRKNCLKITYIIINIMCRDIIS